MIFWLQNRLSRHRYDDFDNYSDDENDGGDDDDDEEKPKDKSKSAGDGKKLVDKIETDKETPKETGENFSIRPLYL